MRTTVLVENYTSRADLIPEYGLSIHLSAADSSILMDTGQKDALFTNAPLLGIDLAAIDHIVLSHGHFDHTGGIGRLLLKVRKPRLWAHEHVGDLHLRARKGNATFIGCHLNRQSVEFHPVLGAAEIVEGVFALEIPLEERDPNFVDTPKHLVVPLKDGGFGTDPFRDDVSLVVKGNRGLSVILGCAHAGVVNILEKASRTFGTRNFYAVIGGMHLGDSSDEYVDKVMTTLFERFRVELWRPCHCTGIRSAWRLASKAGNVEWAGVGTTLEI